MGLLLNNDIDRVMPNGMVLYPHQFQGAKKAYQQGKCVLGYDVGVGKTLTSIAVARAYQRDTGGKVVVVAPASLVDNWRRETEGNLDSPIICSAGKLPLPGDFGGSYFLIADEAHYYQDHTRKRTRAMIALAAAAKGGIFPTATPIRNYPSNLFPLLKMSDHPLGKSYAAFERRFCNGKRAGSSNLLQLHGELDGKIIMGSKEEHLSLPPFRRIQKPINFDGVGQALFDQALEDSRKEYHDRVDKGNISDKAFTIVLINHLRQATSKGKSIFAVRLAHRLLEKGHQIAIFTNYKASGQYIEKHIDSPHYEAHLLDGSVPKGKRQGLVDDFQEGKAQVFIMTRAGSAGLNLQRGTVFISVDRTWSPFDMVQAEGRIHRNGQKKSCTSIWLQDQIIDPWLDKMMLRKYTVAREVLLGKHDTMDGVGRPERWASDLSQILFDYT